MKKLLRTAYLLAILGCALHSTFSVFKRKKEEELMMVEGNEEEKKEEDEVC